MKKNNYIHTYDGFRTSKDIEVNGFHIPKGSHVLANFYAANNDPEIWLDANVFKPERFLMEENKSYVAPENITPFGYGKRSCPAESMANSEIFLYTTSFIQKYDIRSHRQTDLEAKMFGFSRLPGSDVMITFVPREASNFNL